MSHWGFDNWSNFYNWNNWYNFTNAYINPVFEPTRYNDDGEVYDPTSDAGSYYFQQGFDVDHFTELRFSIDSATATDELFLDLSDTSLTISGNTIYSGTTAIATVSGGADGAPLVITPLITGSAQQSYFQQLADLVDSVRYQNEDLSGPSTKVLRYQLTDDDGQVRTYTHTFVSEASASEIFFEEVLVEQDPDSGAALGQVHNKPHITALADGGYLVARSAPDPATGVWEIFVDRFDADGQPVGSSVMVSPSGGSNSHWSSITATSDGGYVVAWTEFGGDTSGYSIEVQRFDADGNSVGGVVQANTYESADQMYPQVVELEGGDVLVVWMSNGQDGSGWGVYGQRFNADGTTDGGEFQINQATASTQYFPKVAALEGGGFVVTWGDVSGANDPSNYGVVARIYDADGAPAGDEFLVNQTTANNQIHPSITVLENGNFVISWNDYGNGGVTLNDITARVFAPDGTPVSDELVVAATANEEYFSTVVANPDGTFTVIYREYDISDGTNSIRGRLFEADGTAIGSDFLVKDDAYVIDLNVAATSLADGSVGIVFFNQASGLHETGVFDFTQLSGLTADYGDPVPVVLDLHWEDLDGSETVQVVLSGFPAGTTFNLGAAGPNDTWVIDITDPSDLDGLVMTVADGYFGTFDLTSTATATESVNDDQSSDAITYAFTINAPPNFAPELDNLILDQNVDEDNAWSFTVPADTFSDPDSDPLTLTATLANGDPLPAWLSFDGTTFSGTPPQDFNGSIDIEVTASDGQFDVSDTFTLTIDPVNDAPAVSAAISGATTNEDAGTYSLDLLANASDVEGDDLDVASVTASSSNAGRTVVFTHDAETGAFSLDPSQFNDLAVGESETVTVSYNVVDGNGGVTPTSASFVVEGRNDAPAVSAAISGATTNEDAGTYSLDLLANASDADTSDDLDVASVTASSSNAGRTVVFTHDAETGSFSLDPSQFNDLAVGESETVTVSYNVVDGNGGVTPTSASFVVEGRNDAPAVSAAISGATTNEDAGTYSLDLLANASDADTSDDLDVASVTASSSNAGRTVVFTHDAETGSFSLDPSQFNDLAVGESETVTVSYNVVDGNGGVTPTSASFVVEGRNDAPAVSAAISGATTNEDAGTYSLDLLANASDADTSDDLDVASVTASSSNAGRTVVFTHDAETGSFSLDPSQFNDLAVGESETVTVSYNVVDGNGGVTPTSASFVVEGRNDAPAVSAAISGATTNEDAGTYSLDLLANASDADTSDDLDVASVTASSSNAGRTVVFTHDAETGSFSLDPSQFNDLAVGESETVTVSYNVVDGNGGVTPTSASFVVEGRNDAPAVSAAISGATTNEDAGTYSLDLLANASDADTSDDLDVASVTASSSNAGRTVVFTHDAETGSFSLDPSQFNDLAVGESETVTVSYNVVDGNGGVTPTSASFVVEGRNDAPAVSAAISGATTNEDAGTYSLDLLANASDADTSDDLDVASVTASSSNAGRTVVFTHDAETGAFSLDPSQFNDLAVGESETVTVSYNVVDGNGGVTPTSASFVVEGRNDAPTAVDQSDTAVEDLSTSGNLLDGASDPDSSDELTVTTIAAGAASVAAGTAIQGQWGTLVVQADGSYTYSADADALDELSGVTGLTDEFDFTISDGEGGTDTRTLTVDVVLADDERTIVDTNTKAIEDLNGDQDLTGSEDTIFGGTGPDQIFGHEGADDLFGEIGDDSLFGGAGRDELFGGEGSDVLDGGDGNDYLEGGAGNDILTGGAGNDVFAFGPANGRDIITDFGEGDVIVFLDDVSIVGQRVRDFDGDGVDDLIIKLGDGHGVVLLGVSEPLVEIDNATEVIGDDMNPSSAILPDQGAALSVTVDLENNIALQDLSFG
ncbi:cadherin-like domain-containing protein [Aurantiacibacter sp. MUD11]|uniref:cadherin-like domain-containing protein n=1 Tax=Aurantiacibacter sp. MUD11 TaxID=3003265 RepID=UPI0022AA4470|nr:cadherin-like domain-containing protein [Aurantiacibacter sp. MUD11]WAT17712.1 cadherin-like domain-containing protein [Aurantiacibacter sp. MUD11]